MFGISLGGTLALNYAVDFPEAVDSLTLINTQFKMPKVLLSLQNIFFKFIPR
ncbi:alpha/beta fold hydrolase [Fundicoccus sp. Sow4_F4]|uniref:alpha/beta fold hydrolase n=1 Tax=Fundicoccus sp. Sow4_F4 TaxID=3438783 RepID=UPI003F8EF54B